MRSIRPSGIMLYAGRSVVEKMRSVMQRMQARDFYDIWCLLEVQGMDIAFYINEFKKKCEIKGLKASDFPRKLTEGLPQYKGRWQSSLSEQIKNLPGFDIVERVVFKAFKEIETLICL